MTAAQTLDQARGLLAEVARLMRPEDRALRDRLPVLTAADVHARTIVLLATSLSPSAAAGIDVAAADLATRFYDAARYWQACRTQLDSEDPDELVAAVTGAYTAAGYALGVMVGLRVAQLLATVPVLSAPEQATTPKQEGAPHG